MAEFQFFGRNDPIMLTPDVAGHAELRSIATCVAQRITQFEKGGVPLGLMDRICGYRAIRAYKS